jgi:hypothetical protein
MSKQVEYIRDQIVAVEKATREHPLRAGIWACCCAELESLGLCANCEIGDMGACPRCYEATGLGCPHGDLCFNCVADDKYTARA